MPPTTTQSPGLHALFNFQVSVAQHARGADGHPFGAANVNRLAFAILAFGDRISFFITVSENVNTLFLQIGGECSLRLLVS